MINDNANIQTRNGYKLIAATLEDKEKLKDYKWKNIYEYAGDISEDEQKEIDLYVEKEINESISKYKIIIVDNKKVGCVLAYKKDDGILMDEIYIDEEYRNRGIGSNIISKSLEENDIAYLWVYKLNEKAVKLYKKLGFNIINETETRYYMKYIK